VTETINFRNEADAQPARFRRECARAGLRDAIGRTEFRMGLKLKIVVRLKDEGVHARDGELRQLLLKRSGLRVASKHQVNTAQDGICLLAGFRNISL
jgi:hypothetical protein